MCKTFIMNYRCWAWIITELERLFQWVLTKIRGSLDLVVEGSAVEDSDAEGSAVAVASAVVVVLAVLVLALVLLVSVLVSVLYKKNEPLLVLPGGISFFDYNH